MGRKAIDYTTREIIFYRFVCNDTEIINTYVGSTIDLVKRRCQHRCVCNNPTNKHYNLKVYQVIRDNSGWDNWKMVEIERRIVKDNQEAERIEQEWIEFYQAKMNTRKAHRTAEEKKEYKKQYHLEHAEQEKEYQKQYNLEHAEKRKEYKNQYRLEHAEQVKEYQKQYNKQYHLEHAEQLKEKQKQYRLEHAEQVKEYQKQYRLENAERIKEYKRQSSLKKKAELNTTI